MERIQKVVLAQRTGSGGRNGGWRPEGRLRQPPRHEMTDGGLGGGRDEWDREKQRGLRGS